MHFDLFLVHDTDTGIKTKEKVHSLLKMFLE